MCFKEREMTLVNVDGNEIFQTLITNTFVDVARLAHVR